MKKTFLKNYGKVLTLSLEDLIEDFKTDDIKYTFWTRNIHRFHVDAHYCYILYISVIRLGSSHQKSTCYKTAVSVLAVTKQI